MTTAQIVLGLLTIVASGLVSAVVTFRLNKAQEERLIYRQKLEELYIAGRRICRNLFIFATVYKPVLEGKATADSAKVKIENVEVESKESLDTIMMLIAIYLPEFKPWLDSLEEIRDQVLEPIFFYNQRQKKGDDKCDDLLEALIDGASQTVTLKAELTRLAAKHR